MEEYVLADTSVISQLTRVSPNSEAYSAACGRRRIAISFQTEAELLSAGYRGQRLQRLMTLQAATLKLPNSAATNSQYAKVSKARKALRKGGHKPGAMASDADMWIISTALEHDLPLLSHDEDQVLLSRHVGVATWTNLPALVSGNPVL